MSGTCSPNNTQYVGRVKWFNSKAGYGFLTVTDGEKSNTDVFVHHSQIQVGKEQYRYLVQGEYVEFEWTDTESSDHDYQAGHVRGVSGGLLMCETRHENRGDRPEQDQDQDQNQSQDQNDMSDRPKQRYRGGGAREGQEEWMLVRRRVGAGAGSGGGGGGGGGYRRPGNDRNPDERNSDERPRVKSSNN